MTPDALAAIEARAAAATAGPWRTGGWYTSAGINDGGSFGSGSVVPTFPLGRCTFCRGLAEPCALSETRDGRVYHVRWFDSPDDWHGISSDATLAAITGNYEEEQGGVCSTPEDAAFIAAARTDVPALLAHITALRAQHAADVAAAVAGERETCARLCEDRAAHLDAGQGEEEPDDANDEEMEGYGRFLEALHLAEAIRGRALAAPAPTTGGA